MWLLAIYLNNNGLLLGRNTWNSHRYFITYIVAVPHASPRVSTRSTHFCVGQVARLVLLFECLTPLFYSSSSGAALDVEEQNSGKRKASVDIQSIVDLSVANCFYKWLQL